MVIGWKISRRLEFLLPGRIIVRRYDEKKVDVLGVRSRVSVQGAKSLGGHFAYLCRGFEFYEVKKNFFCYYFSKRKWKYFYTFYHFFSEKSSKRAK